MKHIDQQGVEGKRWFFNLNQDYWIWQWADEGSKLEDSSVNRIHQLIDRGLNGGPSGALNIIPSSKTSVGDDEEENLELPVPAIYQAEIDARDNFIREVHCSRGSTKSDGEIEIEVSLVFNGEQLREHWTLDRIYRVFRKVVYRTSFDIESFRMHVDKSGRTTLSFKNNYSEHYSLRYDSVHRDAGSVDVAYYYENEKHPVVFVNTSNHAMGEVDTNHNLWKREYTPWKAGSSTFFGNKTRERLDYGAMFDDG